MKKRIVKIIIFVLGFIGLFLLVTKIFQEKWYFSLHINSPETEIWESFYDEPENSIDVLFLGSSHVYNGINPVVFYEETGMRSFNMASSNQDMFMSYVYLQEALKYQKPEYVVFDGARFSGGVFASKAYYQMSFDSMKWSKLKYDSLKEWASYDPEIDIKDRIFTISDYHQRWECLEKEDFTDKGLSTNLNGYLPSTASVPTEMKAYDENDALWDLPELTRIYFEKISTLCFENDINLILILIPDSSTRFGKTEPVKMLAWDYDLTCIDYNDLENFERTGIDPQTDFLNPGHLNTYGATKFTKTLAEDLKMYGGMYGKGDKDRSDSNWQKKISEWEKVELKANIKRETNLDSYLELLAQSDYVVLASVYDEGSNALSDEAIELLKNLGFDCDYKNGLGQSFYGVRDGNKTLSEMSSEKLEVSGELSDGIFYEITSMGYISADSLGQEAQSIIKLAGVDYSIAKRGINFVVYDKSTGKVIDQICFDTYDSCESVRY